MEQRSNVMSYSKPVDLMAKPGGFSATSRFNLVRYHGIFSPSAHWRTLVVPSEESNSVNCSGCKEARQAKNAEAKDVGKPKPMPSAEYSWSELMRRVFEIDVLTCECGGRAHSLRHQSSRCDTKDSDSSACPPKPPPICPAIREQYVDQ